MDSNVLISRRSRPCLASLLALLPGRALPFPPSLFPRIAEEELHFLRPSSELRHNWGVLQAMAIAGRCQPCDGLYSGNVVTRPVLPDDVGDLDVHSLQKVCKPDHISAILVEIREHQSVEGTVVIACDVLDLDIEENAGCSSPNADEKSPYGLQSRPEAHRLRTGRCQLEMLIGAHREDVRGRFRMMSYHDIQYLDYLLFGSEQRALVARCQVIHELRRPEGAGVLETDSIGFVILRRLVFAL